MNAGTPVSHFLPMQMVISYSAMGTRGMPLLVGPAALGVNFCLMAGDPNRTLKESVHPSASTKMIEIDRARLHRDAKKYFFILQHKNNLHSE
jgi:hypothetical protein